MRKKNTQYIDASNKLSGRRNRVIHDPSLHKGDIDSPLAESYRVELTAEMKLSFQSKRVTLNDLLDLAIEIETHRGLLMELSKEMDAEFGTSSAGFGSLLTHNLKDGKDHS